MHWLTTHKSLAVTCIVLVMAMAFFEWTDCDLLVQDQFFHFDTGTWLVDSDAPLERLLFYSGIKGVIIGIGVLCLFGIGLSFKSEKLQQWRQGGIIFILSLALVPLLVAGSKQFTNIYCPYQIQRYDGVYPYIKFFESYPEGFHPQRAGKCFPAGHATGGFAFMALYFVFKSRRTKILGLTTGLCLGWTMGLYQMFKGAHYLSHTVVTMLLAWIIICLIQEGVTILGSRKYFFWGGCAGRKRMCHTKRLI